MADKLKEFFIEVKPICLHCENVRNVQESDRVKNGRIKLNGVCSLHKISISDYHLHTTKCSNFAMKSV